MGVCRNALTWLSEFNAFDEPATCRRTSYRVTPMLKFVLTDFTYEAVGKVLQVHSHSVGRLAARPVALLPLAFPVDCHGPDDRSNTQLYGVLTRVRQRR